MAIVLHSNDEQIRVERRALWLLLLLLRVAWKLTMNNQLETTGTGMDFLICSDLMIIREDNARNKKK